MNRAQFAAQGRTLAAPLEEAGTLAPLLGEGLYRVREAFHCCEKRCTRFAAELLVQLGYDGSANAIVFVPEWQPAGLAIPSRGFRVDDERLQNLEKLTVVTRQEHAAAGAPPDVTLH